MGFLQLADPYRPAIAVLDAEQFFFHPLGQHGGRRQHHERGIGPQRPGMQAAGGKLLDGPHGPAKHHPAIAGRGALERQHQLLHRIGRADQVRTLAGQVAQLLVLALEPRCFQRPAHHVHQLVGLERFFDVFVGPSFDGGDGGFDVAVAGNDHHRQVRVGLLDLDQQVETIKPRTLQPDIEHHHGRTAFGNGRQRAVAVAREPCFISLVLEDAPDEFPDIAFIINDQDVCSHYPAPSLE